MQTAKRLWFWILRWIPGRRERWQPIWVEHEPEQIRSRYVYLIEENGAVWQTIMVCPCGCNATIQLCCLPDTRPRWEYEIHEDGTISLHPSVWRKTGCRSHYIVRRGNIVWC